MKWLEMTIPLLCQPLCNIEELRHIVAYDLIDEVRRVLDLVRSKRAENLFCVLYADHSAFVLEAGRLG